MMQQREANLPHEERVRIGPISVFTLIAVICLAVLAVLAFSTANAAYTMSQRQATSVSGLYLNETAAQEFVAGIDEALAGEGGDGVERALPALCQAAQKATDGRVTASASMEGNVVSAQFVNDNGRVLTIEVTIRDNDTYRIDKWKVTAVQNEEEPQGNLLIVGG